MQIADITRVAKRAAGAFDRWFPMPQMLAPRTIGVDISDASVKWIGFEKSPTGGYEIFTHGSLSLPDGAVARGVIRDDGALAQVLRTVRTQSRTALVHGALPEEAAYVFSMHVPTGTPSMQTLQLVEFEFDGRVPIAPAASVYDFDAIGESAEGLEIGVCVFPREIAESYAAAFEAAGMQPLSFEIESRSIARAVSLASAEHVELLVDFGRMRTGFSVLKHGIPIFTSTVDIGSERMTAAIKERFSLSEADAERLKNDEGLFASGEHTAAQGEIVAQARALADEIARHFHFWDTRRDAQGKRMTPVEKVTLIGGGANLKGLADFIAGKVRSPVERGNVWRNMFSFDDTIPPIDRRTSLQYATAIGLALRNL